MTAGAASRPTSFGRLTRAGGQPVVRFAFRRLLQAIPVLWGVTFLTFLAMNALPGDAARELLGANATKAQVHQLSATLGLTKPLMARYWQWLSDALSGSLGHSLASGEGVASILAHDLPITFELMAYALIVALVLSVPMALVSARWPNAVADRLNMVLSMLGLSIAPFVLALVLVLIFAVKLDILPALGWVPPDQGFGANLRSLTLPAFSLGLGLMCLYARLLRADLLEQVQNEDYIVTARAKGAGPWRVLLRHAMRNSVFGLITVVALNLGTMLGSAVILEDIFSLPGIGAQLLSAITNRDVPVVEGTVLVFAVIVVVANFFSDVLYSVLDPRIRHGGKSA